MTKIISRERFKFYAFTEAKELESINPYTPNIASCYALVPNGNSMTKLDGNTKSGAFVVLDPASFLVLLEKAGYHDETLKLIDAIELTNKKIERRTTTARNVRKLKNVNTN